MRKLLFVLAVAAVAATGLMANKCGDVSVGKQGDQPQQDQPKQQ